jgi:hypothetical protein
MDLCDYDLAAGIIFSQMMYYHSPSRADGNTRLRVEKDGHMWLAKAYRDWWDECRIKAPTARKKIAYLERIGLIKTAVFKFDGVPTKHTRIDFECFEARMNEMQRSHFDLLDRIHPNYGPFCPHVTDGSDPTDHIQMTPRIGSLTQSTPKSTSKEKETPNLLPGQEASSLPPSEPSLPPGDLPPVHSNETNRYVLAAPKPGVIEKPAAPSPGIPSASSDPGFPRLPRANKPDWTAAVRQFVPVEVASLFESLFPEYPTCLTDTRVARGFYEACRRGDYTADRLRVLKRFWKDTGDTPDAQWRYTHPVQFLKRGKAIPLALAACRDTQRMHLEVAMTDLGSFEDEDTELVRQNLTYARDTLRRWPTSRPLLQFMADEPCLGASAASVCFWLFTEKQSTEAVRLARPEVIMKQIREFRSWGRIIVDHHVDTLATWGLAREEITRIHLAERARYDAMIADIRCTH